MTDEMFVMSETCSRCVKFSRGALGPPGQAIKDGRADPSDLKKYREASAKRGGVVDLAQTENSLLELGPPPHLAARRLRSFFSPLDRPSWPGGARTRANT